MLGHTVAATLASQAASTIQFAFPVYSVAENEAVAVISVVRSGDVSKRATVDYSATSGTARAGKDFIPISGKLEFNSGETNKTLTIPILDDGWVESDETVNLSLGGAIGADLGSPRAAVLRIRKLEQKMDSGKMCGFLDQRGLYNVREA